MSAPTLDRINSPTRLRVVHARAWLLAVVLAIVSVLLWWVAAGINPPGSGIPLVAPVLAPVLALVVALASGLCLVGVSAFRA